MLERMGTSLFVTIAVMTVIVAITAGLFARGRSSRALLAGIGFTLLPLGLFLTGMSDLLVSGIESLMGGPHRLDEHDELGCRHRWPGNLVACRGSVPAGTETT